MGQPPQRTAWQLVLLVATAALAASAQGVGAVPTVPAPAAVDQSHDPAAAPPGMWLPFKEIGSMLQQRLAAAAEAIPRSADPQQAMQQSAANQAQAAPSTQSGLVAFNTGNPSNDWGLRSATGTPPQSPASFRARVGGYTPKGQGYMVYERQPEVRPNYDPNKLTLDGMDDMVVPKGYPLQRHITYSNGYKLVNFRIPYGARGPGGPARPGAGAARYPVILLHGISLSSTCWVVNSPAQSLAFILADQGYDVWMINTRGNTFSREHERYTTNDLQFWMFTVDELALQDLPSVVTYVRSVTGAAKVSLVGHSQGGTISTAMLTRPPPGGGEHPIDVLVNVAPVIYVAYIQSPMLASFCIQANNSVVLANLPPQEFLFMGKTIQDLFLNGVCQQTVAVPLCRGFTESMFGISYHITTQQYRRYWQAWPSATSYSNAIQWSQLYSGRPPRFCEFNGGPEYDLTQVKVPVVLFTGGNDVLSTAEDMALTGSRLRQGGSLRETVYLKDYSHMDFIWDTNAPKTAYPAVLAALSRYSS